MTPQRTAPDFTTRFLIGRSRAFHYQRLICRGNIRRHDFVRRISGEVNGEVNAKVSSRRVGAATLDYVLTLSVLFLMSGIIVASSRRIMQLVYELTGFFLAWPFM